MSLETQVTDSSASAFAAQVVSERLSRHVLKNWKRFVEGINEVATIETQLEVRHIGIRPA